MHESGRIVELKEFYFYLLSVNSAREAWKRKKENPAED